MKPRPLAADASSNPSSSVGLAAAPGQNPPSPRWRRARPTIGRRVTAPATSD